MINIEWRTDKIFQLATAVVIVRQAKEVETTTKAQYSWKLNVLDIALKFRKRRLVRKTTIRISCNPSENIPTEVEYH